MRTIVSSEIESDVDLGNGQRSILEVHTDSDGERYEFHVRAVQDFDMSTLLAQRAAWLPGRLAELEKRELTQRIDAGEDPTEMDLAWLSRNEALRYLLKRFANSGPERAIRYVHLIARLTDTQVASLLGVTEQKVSDWRAKLAALKQAKDGYDSGLSFPEEPIDD